MLGLIIAGAIICLVVSTREGQQPYVEKFRPWRAPLAIVVTLFWAAMIFLPHK